jgi:predicted esterase
MVLSGNGISCNFVDIFHSKKHQVMKTNFLRLLPLLFTQFLFAQNVPTHEQAFGITGFESGEIRVIEPAFLPGQYLLGGQINKGAVVVQSNKIGQSLAYRRLNLSAKGESKVTDLIKINNQLFAVAGTCTGCADTIPRQSIFITLHDPNLNQIASLILTPNLTQNLFDNARLATDGTRLYLAFNDNFFGGSLNLRAFDLNLKQLWSSFQNLAFAEAPLNIRALNGQLWVCSQEWSGFENPIGTRLAQFNAETGALLKHYGYAAFVDASAVLPNGNIAVLSYGTFYTGSRRIKLSIISPTNGAVVDSVLLGLQERSRATALQTLPNGQLLLAINEAGFFEDTLKLLRYNPSNLKAPLSTRKIIGDRGAKRRVAYDLLPLSNDGFSYLAVGLRTDGLDRGMFLASFPEDFSPQAPNNWNNNICGTKLLGEMSPGSHYPSSLPQTYEKVVYARDVPLYNGQKQNLYLDLYLPFDLYTTKDLNQKRPLLVMVHGGGFLGGNEDAFSGPALFFAELGYVVASINYRLGVADGVTDITQFCNNIRPVAAVMYRGAQDTRRAIQFLYDNANQYQIDRNNIFALGHSAGAVNVLHSAFLDANELPFDFNTELGPLPPKPPVRAYISWAGSIHSLDMIDKEENTPMFFIHGTCDPLVPYDQGPSICIGATSGFGSKAIAGRKRSLCHNYHLLGIQKGDHGVGGSEAEVLAKLMDWMKNQILCGQAKQTCETVLARTPLNCPEMEICPRTQSCLVATREVRPNMRQPRIYPNPSPANHTVNIELEEDMGQAGEVYLYDRQGKTLHGEKFSGRTIQLDLATVPPGVYLLKIRTDQTFLQSQLVVQ